MIHPLFLRQATLPILNSDFLKFNTLVLTFGKKFLITTIVFAEVKNWLGREETKSAWQNARLANQRVRVLQTGIRETYRGYAYVANFLPR